jgi:alcohol dehydrogenase class IV
MQFEFATAVQILFGAGTIGKLGEAVASLGKCVLLASNLPESRIAPIVADITTRGIRVVPIVVTGEPTVASVAEGVELARKQGCDLVIGLGGGSAIDTGKAVAALTTNLGDINDYLEIVGKGFPIRLIPLPMIAIPTTAGTGSEVTRNAVIGVPKYRVKVSLRSPMLLPKLALVDPQLVNGLPPDITASTGLDALTQLIEPYVSIKANPLTDSICREGMVHVAHSLYRAFETDDPVAREGMSLASLFGGLALANSGLGAVHGFASVLGGMYQIPHGVICARLLAPAMDANFRALEARMPASPALRRYDEVAQYLTGNPLADAGDGIAWVKELCEQLRVHPLADYGIAPLDFSLIVEKTSKASSTKANPIQLTNEELLAILEKAV